MLNKIKKVFVQCRIDQTNCCRLGHRYPDCRLYTTVIPVVKIFWRSLRQSTERRCSRPRIFPCHERDGTKKRRDERKYETDHHLVCHRNFLCLSRRRGIVISFPDRTSSPGGGRCQTGSAFRHHRSIAQCKFFPL